MGKMSVAQHRRLLAELMARAYYDASHRGLNAGPTPPPFESLNFLTRGHRVECMEAVIKDLYAAGYGVLPFDTIDVKKPEKKAKG